MRMNQEDFQHFFELLWAMTEKELRSRYKHTVFGFFWLVANPLLQMIIISFIFKFFMKSPIIHYELYLFLNLLIWNFFSLSLTRATPSIVSERSLIKKAVFPRSIIPLSIILSNLIHLLVAMVLYLVPILLVGTLTLIKIPLIIISFGLLLAFTCGISLFTSALNVRFRDVNFFVQAALIIWLYATPIIYTLNMIPNGYYWLWWLNPMTSIVQLFQFTFLNKSLPDISIISINLIIIFMILILGILMFQKESKNFDDWI